MTADEWRYVGPSGVKPAPPTPAQRAVDIFYSRQLRRYRQHHSTPTPLAERVRIRQCYEAPGDRLAERVIAHVYFTDRGRTCRLPLNRRVARLALHSCPFLSDVYNDSETLCDCDEAQQHECARDI